MKSNMQGHGTFSNGAESSNKQEPQMLDGLQSFTHHFTDGLWALFGLSSGEAQLPDPVKNFIVTVLSLLAAGGIGGAVMGWSQSQVNENRIESIKETQQRILGILQEMQRKQEGRNARLK